MLPAAITNIQQAFKEVKHMTIEVMYDVCVRGIPRYGPGRENRL